jgi:hypothetical protein
MGSNTSSSICTLCLPMYVGCMNATLSITNTCLLGCLQYVYECYYSLNPAVAVPSQKSYTKWHIVSQLLLLCCWK